MNSKVTGQGAAADDGDDVKKKALTFSILNSDFLAQTYDKSEWESESCESRKNILREN